MGLWWSYKMKLLLISTQFEVEVVVELGKTYQKISFYLLSKCHLTLSSKVHVIFTTK